MNYTARSPLPVLKDNHFGIANSLKSCMTYLKDKLPSLRSLEASILLLVTGKKRRLSEGFKYTLIVCIQFLALHVLQCDVWELLDPRKKTFCFAFIQDTVCLFLVWGCCFLKQSPWIKEEIMLWVQKFNNFQLKDSEDQNLKRPVAQDNINDFLSD